MSSRRTHQSSSSRRSPPTASRRRERHDSKAVDSKSKHSRVEVGSHHRRTRSRSPWRSAAPMKPTPFKRGFGERRASQRRPSPATSPIRKKPPPVNELDVASMDVKKEQKQKSGTSPGNVLSSSSHIPQNGGFRVGFGRAAAFDRFYRPLSGRELLRRAPGFAPRRLAGVRDAVDGRNSFGRNKRDEVQRSEQRRKGIEDADKPVMNLFDPCKVPTGKSYFTHDDRSSKPVRARVTRYSDGAVRQGMSDRAPVGWRNVAQVLLSLLICTASPHLARSLALITYIGAVMFASRSIWFRHRSVPFRRVSFHSLF